ncbi:hypothetical protein DFH29DRAFT_1071826 [Suillus ampliporus]|nr:hypothetical protein DFH29DRAFT_1071826 [Suillus ampliporus]
MVTRAAVDLLTLSMWLKAPFHFPHWSSLLIDVEENHEDAVVCTCPIGWGPATACTQAQSLFGYIELHNTAISQVSENVLIFITQKAIWEDGDCHLVTSFSSPMWRVIQPVDFTAFWFHSHASNIVQILCSRPNACSLNSYTYRVEGALTVLINHIKELTSDCKENMFNIMLLRWRGSRCVDQSFDQGGGSERVRDGLIFRSDSEMHLSSGIYNSCANFVIRMLLELSWFRATTLPWASRVQTVPEVVTLVNVLIQDCAYLNGPIDVQGTLVDTPFGHQAVISFVKHLLWHDRQYCRHIRPVRLSEGLQRTTPLTAAGTDDPPVSTTQGLEVAYASSYRSSELRPRQIHVYLICTGVLDKKLVTNNATCAIGDSGRCDARHPEALSGMSLGYRSRRRETYL